MIKHIHNKKNFFFIFKKSFSKTTFKLADSDMMDRINKMLEKSRAFEKEIENTSNLINNKQKFELYRNRETENGFDFFMKYLNKLSTEDQNNVFKSIDQYERMHTLITEKINNIDITKPKDLLDSVKISEMFYNNKSKTFEGIQDIIKRYIDKGVKDGSISDSELDVFKILLGKRKAEAKTFLNLKNNYFKDIKEKLNNLPNNMSNSTNSSTLPKPSVEVPHTSSTLPKPSVEVPHTSGVVPVNSLTNMEKLPISKELPISEELMNIVKDIMDLFS